MAIIDMFVALNKLGDGAKLSKVKVYGKIIRPLNKPVNLYDSVALAGESGVFVEFKVFAIDLTAYKETLAELGTNSVDSVYMVNGSLALYVNSSTCNVTDWYSCEGTVRFGSKEPSAYLTMFKFNKVDQSWVLEQNALVKIDETVFSDNTIEKEYFLQSKAMNSVVVPQQTLLMSSFIAEPALTASVNKFPSRVYSVYNSRKSVIEDDSFFTPENRLHTLQDIRMIEKYNRLFDETVKAHKIRKQFIDSLKANFSAGSNCNSYTTYLYERIFDNLKHKITSETYTGRTLIKDYLKTCFAIFEDKDYMGVDLFDYIIDDFEEIKEYVLNQDTQLGLTEEAFKLVYNAFGNPEMFYAFVCARIFGLSSDTLLDIEATCYSNHLSFSKILNENPYVLQCIGNLGYNDVETIAMALGKATAENLQIFRRITILDSYITNTERGNTLFSKDYLGTHSIGLSLTVNQYEKCKQTGTYLSDWTIAGVKGFIKNIDEKQCGVALAGFTRVGNRYEQNMPRVLIDDTIEKYRAIGLGVLVDNKYVTSSKILEKELYIFDYMYQLSKEETGYTDAEIDACIDEYEKEVGFTLEPEQRQAVHLLKYKAACVAGSAGSGKTTTSKCFTYVIEHLEKNCVDLRFATPTGKAAKRLQEVVKRPVKTMNSMFKTFGDSEGIFKVDAEFSQDDDAVYIFDENAMVTLDLLYSCLLKIKNSRIYLFGDFHQLPPIGKGLPFKNLLRILPSQFLTVSKRAAENSGITLNSNYINEYSEPNNWHDLVASDDFIIAPCSENVLSDLTADIVRYYLNKPTIIPYANLCQKLGVTNLPVIADLQPDDIQVVSPLAKSTYTWGANQLNTVLEPIFNTEQRRNKTFIYQTSKNGPRQKFVIGDRVIHNNKNMYSMQWYSKCEKGHMQKTYGFGVNNGEVGTIAGFVKAKNCKFFSEVGTIPQDFSYPDHLRNDKTYKDDYDYFVIVKYFDYLSNNDFFILYRCKLNTDADDREGLVFKGEDLSMLSLFYAGTCHKMQGSQAKLIIAPLGYVNYNGFITRNMMYTVYTRATNAVITLGSVSNANSSMLTKARKIVAENNVFTVGEYLCNIENS